MSYAPYPQWSRFFYQSAFCNTASHIWQATCQRENRKYFLEKRHPNLCKTLETFDDYFGKESSCTNWPKNYFQNNAELNWTLLEEVYEYGKENLALVHIFIQRPYITVIKRDMAMTFTDYVANTGGLLGLCLGFSFISAIELFYWCCMCFRLFFKKRVHNFN